MPRNTVLILLIFLILITLGTGGCWDAMDINDFYIPFVTGYDLLETDGENKFCISINFPILNPDAKKKSDVLLVEGETIAQTRIDRANKSSRGLALGDVKAVLIGESLARRGTKDVFDVMFREARFSEMINLAVTEGAAKDVLMIEPVHYQTVGQNIIDLLNNTPRDNYAPIEHIHHFREDIYNDGFNPIMPIVKIHGNNKLKISGAALFKKYKMVAKVGPDDMRPLIWLRGQENKGDILFEMTDTEGKVKKFTFEGRNSRSVNAKIENGIPTFEIEINLTGIIVEAINDFRFAGEEKNILLVQQALEKRVKGQCEDFLEELQNNYKVDAILLGRYARAKWPPLVEEQDWDEVFCNSIIKVKVNATIQGTGELA